MTLGILLLLSDNSLGHGKRRLKLLNTSNYFLWIKINTVHASVKVYIYISLWLGLLYHPWPWHSTTQPGEDQGPGKVRFNLEVPIPEKHCEGETCKFHMGGAEWFSNSTRRNTDLSPEPTITLDMYDKWHLQSKPECVNNPWSSPGTAKIYGSCGTNGGNPNGCGQGEGQTNITSEYNNVI